MLETSSLLASIDCIDFFCSPKCLSINNVVHKNILIFKGILRDILNLIMCGMIFSGIVCVVFNDLLVVATLFHLFISCCLLFLVPVLSIEFIFNKHFP